MPTESSDYPQAYLITFRTYGSWLHGDERGSVDRSHNQPGSELSPPDARRLEAMRRRLKASAFALSAVQRGCVDQSLAEVCVHRGWDLIAANVRTNHVHVIVATSATPEKVMNDFKSRATRRLREERLVLANAVIWSRHGSTRYLWTDANVEDAYRYVVEGQGADLEG